MGTRQHACQRMVRTHVAIDLDSQQQQSRDYEYQHFLNFFHKSGDKFSDEVEIIEKDVIRGRTDFNVFNYSMK